MLKFEILAADGSVSQVITSDKPTIKVGKLTTNNVVLNDPSVGAIHAQVELVDAATCKVTDRNSIGGTYINDMQVSKGGSATFTVGSVLRFGKISVRISDDSEEEGGATITASTEEMLWQANSVVPTEAPAAVPAPSAVAAPAAVPAPAAVSAPSVKLSKPAPAAAAAAPVASGAFAARKASAFGGGFNTSSPVPKKIIRKKRPVSFERRFLSEKCPNGNGIIEVALVWKGNVLSLRQFKTKPKAKVTAGARTAGKGRVDFGIMDQRLGGAKTILSCNGSKWMVCIDANFDGFVVVDPKLFGQEKIMLKDLKPNSAHGVLNNAGVLQMEIDGMTRVKLEFGEAAILIHMAKPSGVVLPFFGGLSQGMVGSFVASLLIHAAFFSLILFATDRVDALMIDRILTTSRFAEALIQPPEEEQEKEEDKPDENEPEDPVEEESTADADSEPTPFAANEASGAGESTGSGMSRSEAIGVAQATGLLAQANAMNSMLAVGANLDNMDLDWSSFDANAAAASAGYGMGMVGGGGGGAAMGGFGAGGFGPGGRGGGGAVGAAARSHSGNLGEKSQGAPKMKALNPDVSGSLDKRVIQRIVRQHTGELRACYERELAKVKGLNGKVTMNWFVSADGSVTKVFVKETTMKNKNVENCMKNSIQHWRFPAPKGGGMCSVIYPFDFSAGSSD